MDGNCVRIPKFLYDKLCQLSAENAKFQKACDQLILLDNRERDLQTRYRRAKAEHNRSMRYSIRMQLAGVSSVKLMYYRYSEKQADIVNNLTAEVRQAYGIHHYHPTEEDMDAE